MDSNTLLSVVLALAVVAGLGFYLFSRNKTETPAPAQSGDTRGLQLQAYERLILLSDRIAIPNLISRTPAEGLSARDMQLVLTRSIRDEFEYNVTQQIYVSAAAWTALKQFKENNLLIINQVATVLPPTATGMELNKAILELLVKDEKGSLHEKVSEVLSFEAKKVLV
jgi:hypothetical protein